MPIRHKQKNIPWLGIGIAIIGILFCLYSSSNEGKFLCITSGCALNKDFTIAGISAWRVGGVAFAVYVVSSLILGKKAALPLATLYLIGDSFFLLLMGLTLPCVPCLIAGLLFALLFSASNIPDKSRPNREKFPLSLGIWGILFVLNLILVFKEYAEPAPMFGTPEAPIKVYFSPSCPACKDAVSRYAKAAQAGTVALYPVAESDQDMLIIATMQKEADSGASPETALAKALEHPIASLPFRFQTLIQYWRLWANKAMTFSLGNGQVPLIIYNGLPVLNERENRANTPLRQAETARNMPLAQETNGNTPANSMDIFNTELRNCGGQTSTEDCATP